MTKIRITLSVLALLAAAPLATIPAEANPLFGVEVVVDVLMHGKIFGPEIPS